MMNRPLATTALLALATALLVLPAAAAAGPKPPATANAAEALLRLDGPDHATAEIRQSWEGPNAKGMRQSLNAIFGNKDDTLTQAELDSIAAAVSRDLQGHASPFLTWDGQPAMVGNATVTFENGPGATTSGDPMTMVHALDIALTPREGAQHELVLSPMWNATLRLEWTEAWAATAAGALDAPVTEPNALTAKVGQGTPLTVTLAPPQPAAPAPAADPAAAPGGQESTGADAAPADAPQKRKLPGPGAWGLVAVLAGTAGLAAWRGRKER
jgi:hypothetical protein